MLRGLVTGAGLEPATCGLKVQNTGETSFTPAHSRHTGNELPLGRGPPRTPWCPSVAEGSGTTVAQARTLLCCGGQPLGGRLARPHHLQRLDHDWRALEICGYPAKRAARLFALADPSPKGIRRRPKRQGLGSCKSGLCLVGVLSKSPPYGI
jgi:hypothetical protein